MPFVYSLKQKTLALVVVFLLFFFVGTFLFLISKNNKEKTEALRVVVLKQQAEKKISDQLAKMHFNASSTGAVSAESFLTLAVTSTGEKKVINQKNPDWALPIASITKLILAIIVSENLDPEMEIKATTDYIGQEESFFVLETDKKYKVKELLANMLIASDNDSARLLGSAFGEANLVAKMNTKAQALGLDKTYFVNITGLDPKKPVVEANISSPNNLANLVLYLQKNHPDLLAVTANASYNFCDINSFCKVIVSTNKFLATSTLPYKIIGGKTGSTDLALKNLVLIVKITEDISLVNIVLGSKNNFADTAFLINNVLLN
jgi:D-alanyl-D-alanine carboxypeptidase